MKKIWIIIKREYLSRVKKKSFIIISLLGPIIIAGVISTIIWFSMQEEEKQQKILVVDMLYPVFERLKNTEKISFEHSNITEEKAYEIFPNSNYTGILVIPKKILTINTALLYFKKQPSLSVLKSIESRIEKVVENEKLIMHNISRKDFDEVNTNFNIRSYIFSETGKSEKIENEKTIVGFFFGIAIYVFIILYGTQVMRGVLEEKSSRIIEIIITSIKPFQLMMGKIIGIALVGLTQFLIWTILSITITTSVQTIMYKNKFEKILQQEKSIDNVFSSSEKTDIISPNHILNRINFPLMLTMFCIYFLGGYLLYAALFAAVGAASETETDSQQFLVIITSPLLIAYILSSTIIQNPTGPAAFWGSIIPLTSPVVMMVRLASGIEAADVWQLYLSIALLFIGFILAVLLSAKIYRTGILMYGKKITYKELWKWIKLK